MNLKAVVASGTLLTSTWLTYITLRNQGKIDENLAPILSQKIEENSNGLFYLRDSPHPIQVATLHNIPEKQDRAISYISRTNKETFFRIELRLPKAAVESEGIWLQTKAVEVDLVSPNPQADPHSFDFRFMTDTLSQIANDAQATRSISGSGGKTF